MRKNTSHEMSTGANALWVIRFMEDGERAPALIIVRTGANGCLGPESVSPPNQFKCTSACLDLRIVEACSFSLPQHPDLVGLAVANVDRTIAVHEDTVRACHLALERIALATIAL